MTLAAREELAKRTRLASERNVEWAKYLSNRADVRTHDENYDAFIINSSLTLQTQSQLIMGLVT